MNSNFCPDTEDKKDNKNICHYNDKQSQMGVEPTPKHIKWTLGAAQCPW